MKQVIVLAAALFFSATAFCQATPHEKKVVESDLKNEKAHRHAVAKNVLRGKPEQAKAEHRAAVASHKKTKRDIKKVHDNDIKRAEARH